MAETKSTARANQTASAKQNTGTTPSGEKPAPEEGIVNADGVVASAPVPEADVEAQTEIVKAATEADPAKHVAAGQSFYNPAAVGSGTILPDGTYGDPLPDPQIQRVAQDSDAQIK